MWREHLTDTLNRIGQHPAWGVDHCWRVYRLAAEMAVTDPCDEEIVFAAAMAHDFGAYPPYRTPGVNHAAQSAEVAVPMLIDAGFPIQKADALRAAIIGHMYDADPGPLWEARLIHDADALDFIGAIGAARQLMMISQTHGPESLTEAAEVLLTLAETVPAGLVTERGRELGELRRSELVAFVRALKEQGYMMN